MKKLNGTEINEIQCAECNDSPLCNNETFFEKQLFCLEKLENETKLIKGTRVCKDKCYVSRNYKTGKVTHGCRKCQKNDPTECLNCNEDYCNTEDKVHKHCWADNNKICKTPFYDPCYLWRTPTNEVEKGCGNCPFYTCKECNKHLCNNETVTKLPFYCFGKMASFVECHGKKQECYIAKIEAQQGEEKIDQFHYDCGKCPSGILDLSRFIKAKNTTLQNKLKKINMTNVQCVQCKNRPACNSNSFFESQLFCLEKNSRKWKAKKGLRVCEKESCFIGVDKNEMGLVQGCGKCSNQQNLNKCANCSKTYCNEEKKLAPSIKCYHLRANSQPFEKKEKTCHYVYESCYIAMDVFWRVEQNCGDCPSKYKNCVTCNISLCNEEAFLPLTTTKIKETSTSTSKSTTKTASKKITISPDKTTKRRTVSKSSAQNKLENKLIVVTTIYILFTLIFYIL